MIARVRTSIAIFSYDGGLYFGVTGDYDSSSDIDILTQGVERSMAEIVGVAGAPPAARMPAESGEVAVESEQRQA